MYDTWDIIAVVGGLLIVAGVACIYWPAGLITSGVFLIAAYILREYASDVPEKSDSREQDEPGEPHF